MVVCHVIVVPCFTWLRCVGLQEPGKVCHQAMQGGAARGLGMTAYILVTLLEHERAGGTNDRVSGRAAPTIG